MGLGNPGPTYSFTYHNLGYIFLDFFSEKLHIKFSPGRGPYYIANKKGLFLLKPTTYMNLSGVAIVEFLTRENNIEPENIIVIHDDLDMPKFSVKLKFGGSSGGHRGIESIIYHLKTENFWRLKLGISKPHNISPREYVLSKIPQNEIKRYALLFEDMSNILQNIGIKDIETLQQGINTLRKKYVVSEEKEG